MSFFSEVAGVGDAGGTFGTGNYNGNYSQAQQDADLKRLQQSQGAQVDPTQQAQARDAQLGLVRQYQQQAAGQGPSLAQMQLQQATQQNQAQALGMLGANRGLNPGAAARLAGQQLGAANQQAAGQSAMARLAEQYQAQQGLAGLSGQLRGQDLELAGQNAQLAQQNNQFNAGQFNQVFAQLQAEREQRIRDQNAQIAQMEAARRGANAQLRGQLIAAGATVGSAAAGGGAGAAAGV